jgi:predicted O-methyltransferase YrrM
VKPEPGVGLAWLATGADPRARLVSVEREPARAAAAAVVFHTTPQVQVVSGDWLDLRAHGPFDLLVLDGGGHGKGGAQPLDPAEWLNLGATVVIDDFTPSTDWPPSFGGSVDRARLYWLEHPCLVTTQVRVVPEMAVVLATRVH